MDTSESKAIIVKMLKEKSCMKQDVFHHTINVFEQLKTIVQARAEELNEEISCEDDRVNVTYKEKSQHDIELAIAGDVLIFHVHTNVFKLDDSSSLWKTSYLKEDPLRGYCGVINVYNFLADSFRYNRVNDLGYLIARIFINKDNHFFVQGKRQMGFLYNDFPNATLEEETLKKVVDSTIIYTLDFDLLTPPYDHVKQASVYEMKTLSDNVELKTGKRLGFKFQADTDDFE